jgi:beta-lactamase class A
MMRTPDGHSKLELTRYYAPAALACQGLLESSEPAARIDSVTGGIQAVFEQASCEGMLCAQSLDGHLEVGLRADEPVVPASVVKVQVALEAQTWFADGRLDPREPVRLSAANRTFGPTGTSLFDDDAVVSWRTWWS